MYHNSIPLTVTTRGIGIAVSNIDQESVEQFHYKPLPGDSSSDDEFIRKRSHRHPSIYPLYRASLGLLETKLNLGLPSFTTIYKEEDINNNLCEYYDMSWPPKVPTPIAKIIDTIGLVVCGDRAYHPVVAAPVYYEDGKLMPRAENLVLSTLRQTVEALADPATPQEHRARFKDTCPIPGAVWNDDDTLSNPDDIIPQGYTLKDDYFSNFQRDIQEVQSILSCGFRAFDQIMVNINKDTKTGDMSMLSSNVLLEMRVSPRLRDEALDVYSKRCRLEGDMSEYFTSPVRLNTTQQVNGILHMLGEVPTDYRTHYKYIYVPRERMCHAFRVHRHARFINLYTNMKRLELEEARQENNEAVNMEANRVREPQGGRRHGRGRRPRRNQRYQ